MIYNPKKAVEYAKEWWNKRNNNFYNFDELGGDCTNFICQCLLAGGYKMKVDIINGWFYKSLNFRSPSFSGVNEFYNFAINNKDFTSVKVKKIDLAEIQIGDIIQLRQNPISYNHSLIVTDISLNNSILTTKNIFVATHTVDSYNRCLCNYNFLEYRCLHPF